MPNNKTIKRRPVRNRRFKLNFSEFLNIFIPVITFFLGIIITTLIEKDKRKNEKLDQYINETSELVNDWYNQLYQLNYDNKKRLDSIEIKRAMFFYSQNRLILPRILKNIEIIKNSGRCQTLALRVEGFLCLVTNYKAKNDNVAIKCTDFFLPTNELMSLRHAEQQKLDNILLSLDTLNQKISIEAGNLLR
jgi:hypothetical protein